MTCCSSLIWTLPNCSQCIRAPILIVNVVVLLSVLVVVALDRSVGEWERVVVVVVVVVYFLGY